MLYDAKITTKESSMNTYQANFIYQGTREGIEHNGEIFWGTDCVGKLCRKLKEGILKITTPEGTPSLTVNISKRAKKMLVDNNIDGTRYKPYMTFTSSNTFSTRTEGTK